MSGTVLNTLHVSSNVVLGAASCGVGSITVPTLLRSKVRL